MVMTLLELYNLAEKENIEIDNFPMKEVVAMSFPQNWIVMDIRKIQTSTEEKVYLAHELGHCMTGSFYNIESKLNFKNKCETKANRWAIKTLIPKEKLKQAIRMGLHETWELAEYFDVPEFFIRQAIEYYRIRGEKL